MKIRLSFVANSSSSSFLFALPPGKKLTKPSDLKEILFGSEKYLVSNQHKGVLACADTAAMVAWDLLEAAPKERYFTPDWGWESEHIKAFFDEHQGQDTFLLDIDGYEGVYGILREAPFQEELDWINVGDH